MSEEAQRIRELLRGRHPGADHRSVSVEDASESTCAFWATVGWAPFMEALDLVPPERLESESRIESTLSGWRDAGMSTLTRDALPERVRMVTRDTAGVGFLVADETTGAADPPLLAVICDTNQVRPSGQTYLAFVARTLVGVSSMSTWVRAQPASLWRGRSLFPVLLPDIVETDLGLHIEEREGSSAFVASSPGQILKWLREAPVERVEIDTLGTSLYLGDAYADVHSRLTDVLELPAWDPGSQMALGHLDGIEVLLHRTHDASTIHGDCPADELFYRAHDVAPSRWPVDRAPLPLAPHQQPNPSPLRALLHAMDPSHGALDAKTNAPSTLAEFLEAVGRGPLIDDLWPVEGTLPGGPTRGRVIARSEHWTAYSDEDEGRPDPVAVWKPQGQVVLAAARSTSLFAANVVHRVADRLAVEANRVLKGVPWGGQFHVPTKLAEGVYVSQGVVFARDASMWLDYLGTLDERVVRGAGPPKAFGQSELKAPSKKQADQVASLGLRKTKRTMQEYVVAGTRWLGLVEATPVWIDVFDQRPARGKTRRRIVVRHPAGARELIEGLLGPLV